MIDFYNAFISYKHADLDSSIAEHIQNRLEHFHVPRKIGKKLKHEKISRIFRDKDELPATSNLTETITDALEKAEHLIVICSTNTKKSIWVQREIETFLKTHSIDKILTVLCDGEPNDVIPEILLFREQELKDENGVLRKVKIPMEPLSCDYRLGKKQADKEELARLASAILGCSYDELQRRRRQYKIRRAIAVGSVVVASLMAFGGYMIYANKKINESLNEALRNRSRYLANEAETLLGDSKRTDALQIALEAMPKDLDDKSLLIPKAERALVDATAAYSSSDSKLQNTWNFKVNSKISMFAVSKEGGFVAIKDDSGKVTCFSVTTKKILFEKNDGSGIIKILNPEGAFVFVSHNKIEAYSIKDGKQIWCNKFTDREISFASHVVMQGDKLYYQSSGTVHVLSLKDGKDIAEYKICKWQFNKFCVSPSGDKIAFDFAGLGTFKTSGVNVYDVNTGETIDYTFENDSIKHMLFVGDQIIVQTGRLYVYHDIDPKNNYVCTNTETQKVFCFDSSLQLKWTAETDYDTFDYDVDMLDLSEHKTVACNSGNVVCVYDVASGELLYKFNIGSSVCHMSDPDGDGLPMMIGYDGMVYFPVSNQEKLKNGLNAYKMLSNDIDSAYVQGAIFSVSKESKDLNLYAYGLQDDEFNLLPGTERLVGHSQAFDMKEDILFTACAADENNKGTLFTAIDPADGSVMYTKEIKEDFDSFHSLLGRCENNFYYKVEKTDYLYKIDAKTGDHEKITLKDYDIESCTEEYLEDDIYFYFKKIEGEKKKLYVMDLKDQSVKEFETDLDYNARYLKIHYVQALKKIFFVTDEIEHKICIADLKGKEKQVRELEMPDSWIPENVLLCITTNADASLIYFAQRNMIMVTDASFKEKYSINCEGITPAGLVQHKKGIYVLSNGYLSVYDDKTGDLIKRFEISIDKDPLEDDRIAKDTDIDFDEGSDKIYVRYEDIAIVLDRETMTEVAHVDFCYGYHKGSDRFYVFRGNEGLGYFKHYTAEDLIKKAEKILNGQPIPPEYKEKYGIE